MWVAVVVVVVETVAVEVALLLLLLVGGGGRRNLREADFTRRAPRERLKRASACFLLSPAVVLRVVANSLDHQGA